MKKMKCKFCRVLAVGTFLLSSTNLASAGTVASAKTTLAFVEDEAPALEISFQRRVYEAPISLSVYASGSGEISAPTQGLKFFIDISREELASFLSEIQAGDLLNYDEESLVVERVRLLDGHVLGVSEDTPAITLHFRLVEETAAGAPVRNLENTLSFRKAEYLASRFPTMRVYRSLAFIEKTFFSHLAAKELVR
ncbi:MAG: hypothetical protein ABI639_09160 [Thermoanaerobaculia bacterium]